MDSANKERYILIITNNFLFSYTYRFRFLLAPMWQKTKNVEAIVLGACVLHNILRTRFPTNVTNLADREHPTTHEVLPGTWRDDDCLVGLERLKGNNSTNYAKAVREYQRAYYTSPVGSVPWQDAMI